MAKRATVYAWGVGLSKNPVIAGAETTTAAMETAENDSGWAICTDPERWAVEIEVADVDEFDADVRFDPAVWGWIAD